MTGRTQIYDALPFSRVREGDQCATVFPRGGVLDHLGSEQAPVGPGFWLFLEEHLVGVQHHTWCRNGM